MKKFLATLAVLTLALAMLAPALAEDLPEINWTDIDIESTGIEGDFYVFNDVAVMVWIPDIFESLDMTAEEVEDGMIGKFEIADGSAGIYAQLLSGAEGMTMEAMVSGLEASGATEIDRCILNGLDAASYTLPDTDAVYVLFVTEAGNILQFVMTPASDEGFAAVAQLVTASIQPEQ